MWRISKRTMYNKGVFATDLIPCNIPKSNEKIRVGKLSSVITGPLYGPQVEAVTETNRVTGELCLARPLLEVPLIVFQADVDALSEVVLLRDGLQEVGLHQCDVIELRGAGCTSVSAAGLQENLGLNDGVLVVLSYVVVYEDVLNMLVEGVNPQRFPPPDGGAVTGPPVKVVLKAPQALGRAEVLVQPPLSVTRRQVLLSSAQDHSLPAAADLSRRNVHAQLELGQIWEQGVSAFSQSP